MRVEKEVAELVIAVDRGGERIEDDETEGVVSPVVPPPPLAVAVAVDILL